MVLIPRRTILAMVYDLVIYGILGRTNYMAEGIGAFSETITSILPRLRIRKSTVLIFIATVRISLFLMLISLMATTNLHPSMELSVLTNVYSQILFP